jgi:hypothetical protein
VVCTLTAASRAQEAGAPLSPERRALIERVLGLQPSAAPVGEADGRAVPPVRPVAPELCAAMYMRKLAERVRLTVRPAGLPRVWRVRTDPSLGAHTARTTFLVRASPTAHRMCRRWLLICCRVARRSRFY